METPVSNLSVVKIAQDTGAHTEQPPFVYSETEVDVARNEKTWKVQFFCSVKTDNASDIS
ncbi:MAG: hypothetical protein QNK23_16775 [Crocinitomicaceae bacterium]|nr:hypothetical protein [Crocinitomicaceae bacterium]